MSQAGRGPLRPPCSLTSMGSGGRQGEGARVARQRQAAVRRGRTHAAGSSTLQRRRAGTRQRHAAAQAALVVNQQSGGAPAGAGARRDACPSPLEELTRLGCTDIHLALLQLLQ
jgi:hypothetical protein